LITLPISATASILIPAFVLATETEAHTLSVEASAEGIELIEVIYRPEHGSCAFLYDRQEMNHFIKNSGIENLQFGLKEPPALKNMTPQSICIIFHREDVQKIFLKFYSDGVIEKEENGVSLYSSNALDMETFENYMELLNGNK
jgi:hypothetical protein